MGDPIQPTAADRLATQALAARIVASVREDAEMPLGLEDYSVRAHGRILLRADVESLAFTLSDELVRVRAERDEAIRLCAKAMTGGNITHADSNRMSDFCKLIGYEP
jgi:hypothetical protein